MMPLSTLKKLNERLNLTQRVAGKERAVARPTAKAKVRVGSNWVDAHLFVIFAFSNLELRL